MSMYEVIEKRKMSGTEIDAYDEGMCKIEYAIPKNGYMPIEIVGPIANDTDLFRPISLKSGYAGMKRITM